MGDNVYIAYALAAYRPVWRARVLSGQIRKRFCDDGAVFHRIWPGVVLFSRFFVQTFCNLQARAGAAAIRFALYGYGSIKSTIGGNEK